MHEYKQTETKLTQEQLEAAILLQTRFNDLLNAMQSLEVPTESMRNRIHSLLMQKLEDRSEVNVSDLLPVYQLFADEEQGNKVVWDLETGLPSTVNSPTFQDESDFMIDFIDHNCGGSGVMD